MLVASSYSDKKLPDLRLTQMCQRGHFWLVFTLISTTFNNTRQYKTSQKTVTHFDGWSVNVLTTRKVWHCSTFKCTGYTLASISKFWVILTLVLVGGLSALDIPEQMSTFWLAVIGGLSALDKCVNIFTDFDPCSHWRVKTYYYYYYYYSF